ncbi:DNA cytosine methyltransferase [Orrella marina]|uniref:DNA cytosine methyltransferase n=1 Tax=Orrella marina TaxID=2163011 RepID=UPI0026B8BE32|nr:DNA cytosine methyltransferase [Orrella marina]
MAQPLYLNHTIEAIDLFCGVGGLSYGLVNKGINVVGGFDLDAACEYPFLANNYGAKFFNKDVSIVQGPELLELWSPGLLSY